MAWQPIDDDDDDVSVTSYYPEGSLEVMHA